jgi:hypothetical protein
VTFQALQGFFESNPNPSMSLASVSGSTGKPVKWDIFSGQLQILNDNDVWLAGRLKQQPPLIMMLDTLTGYLAQPRLHWCKLFGKYWKTGKIGFGCSIDGQKSPEAEAEMARKFGTVDTTPRDWEFRQFLVLRPACGVDPALNAKLQEKMKQVSAQRPSNWWSRLTGRKQE